MASEYNPLRGLISNISLVGTDDEIKTQISLLLGIAQIQEAQFKGLDIDFLKWIDAFENGFGTGFAPKQNTSLAAYWGQTQKTRPKIRILSETGKDKYWQNQGYYLVEFQPDRTNEQESYLLFGTPKKLIEEILYWQNLHLKLSKAFNVDMDEVLAAIEREPPAFDVTGKPKVKLLFLENYPKFLARKNKDSRANRVTAQISFRLTDKTNASLTQADIEALARKIKAKFVNPVFKFIKGKEYYRYNEAKAGFPLRCWAKNESEARRLYDQTLELINEKPALEKMRKILSLNPNKTYRETEKTEIIVGKPVKLNKLRPVVEVEFVAAYIILQGLPNPIWLVHRFNPKKSLVNLD